jgi:hypothetical protein
MFGNKLTKAKQLLEDNGYLVSLKEGDWLKIPELGIEVEIEVHDKDKSWKELNLSSKEEQLLTAEQCIFLVNNEKYSKILKMDGSSTDDDFFIKQPFNFNKKNGYVAYFGVSSDGAYLYCDWDADYSNSYRGVRFVRKISKRAKK